MADDKLICYVCGNPVKQQDNSRLAYIGQGKYRHPYKCHPGSKAWMNSEAGKNSSFREFYSEDN